MKQYLTTISSKEGRAASDAAVSMDQPPSLEIIIEKTKNAQEGSYRAWQGLTDINDLKSAFQNPPTNPAAQNSLKKLNKLMDKNPDFCRIKQILMILVCECRDFFYFLKNFKQVRPNVSAEALNRLLMIRFCLLYTSPSPRD